MQKFQDKREEFNYYVLKSKWYEQNGDLLNCKKCLDKATELKKELDNQNKKSQ